MRIIVTKIGTVFRTQEEIRKGGHTASGEVGETEGLIRYLIKKGHEVTYFGQFRGEIPGLRVIQSHLKGIDDMTTIPQQEAAWRIDEENLGKPGDYDLFFTVAGYAAARSFVTGKHILQAAGIRYLGPINNALRYLKAPRVLVNNDPRTYPRCQEIAAHPELQPAAILDQIADAGGRRSTPQILCGDQFMRHMRYAACESWAYLQQQPITTEGRELDCLLLAHAHVKDGIKQKTRLHALQQVVGDLSKFPYTIFGKGWQHYEPNSEGRVVEPCKPGHVPWYLSQAFTCPVIQQKNFYTGKPYVLVANGVVPLLYGDVNDPNEYTADPRLLFSRGIERITHPSDTIRMAETISRDEETYNQLIRDWRSRLTPRYDVLDGLLDHVNSGRPLPFYEEFGGLERSNG